MTDQIPNSNSVSPSNSSQQNVSVNAGNNEGNMQGVASEGDANVIQGQKNFIIKNLTTNNTITELTKLLVIVLALIVIITIISLVYSNYYVARPQTPETHFVEKKPVVNVKTSNSSNLNNEQLNAQLIEIVQLNCKRTLEEISFRQEDIRSDSYDDIEQRKQVLKVLVKLDEIKKKLSELTDKSILAIRDKQEILFYELIKDFYKLVYVDYRDIMASLPTTSSNPPLGAHSIIPSPRLANWIANNEDNITAYLVKNQIPLDELALSDQEIANLAASVDADLLGSSYLSNPPEDLQEKYPKQVSVIWANIDEKRLEILSNNFSEFLDNGNYNSQLNNNSSNN